MNDSIPQTSRIPFIGRAITWRGFLLAFLYLMPPIVYFCLGAWWLFEKGLLVYGLIGWLSFTILFSILSRRWLKDSVKVLPALDWEKPSTFAPRDAKAWSIVQETAERASDLTLDQLTDIDTFRNASDELARRVAACYYPNVDNPLDKLPIVDLIVAIQLAAEDLEKLCRQIPVMDQLTAGHLKGLTKAMGVAHSANELYNFALPVFRPVTGIPRLLVQKLVAEPAWRQTKEGVQRWLYKAYVNRLGVHLVELCSGRLRGGSAAYRNSPARSRISETNQTEAFSRSATEPAPSVALKLKALMPGLSEKSSRERLGLWKHLAVASQHEVAEVLNSQLRSLEGIDYLPDLEWDRCHWPNSSGDFIPNPEGESWEDSLEVLITADVILADFRALPDDEAQVRAQTLIDRLAEAYDRHHDWPVAPILLIADEGVLVNLESRGQIRDEVRLASISTDKSLHQDGIVDESMLPEPETETIAALASVLPLARQKRFARLMVGEARRSGFRRAAGQVAEAAGKAGIEMVRGWLKRKSTGSASAPDRKEESSTDEKKPS